MLSTELRQFAQNFGLKKAVKTVTRNTSLIESRKVSGHAPQSVGVRPVAKTVELSVLASITLASLVDPALIRWGAVYVNSDRGTEWTQCDRGDHVRFHPNPRRFFGDRETKIVSEHDDFIVVDKPAGLPVHGTCDNAVENLVAQLSQSRGESLWICHRLDIGTSGLVVLARTLEFRRHFGAELALRNVGKRYEAIVSRPIPLGEHRHFQRRRLRAPYSMHADATGDARECLLRVLECSPVGTDTRVTVEPITGRQHQIRAQLAFLGAPIEGDILYGAERALPCDGDGEAIALRCTALTFPMPDGRTMRYAVAPAPRNNLAC